MKPEHVVQDGLPPVEDVVSLLDSAYDGWGDPELFEWKYGYPGTDRDDHNLYIETDSTLTAFARLYHREALIGDERYTAVVRGNAAVHPDYRQMGQYRALHEATRRHCESAGVDLVMTYNRRDNHSFRTDAKSEWTYVTLPLYLNILSPSAAVSEYGGPVIEAQDALRRVVSTIGDHVRVVVGDETVPLSILSDGEPERSRGVTVYLSRGAFDELVALAANGASVPRIVRRGATLLADGEVSPVPIETSDPSVEMPDRCRVLQPGAEEAADISALEDLNRRTTNDCGAVGRFSRSREDFEHMLNHPNLLGSLWIERDRDLSGFAAIVGTRTGSVLEGRVADVVALDRIARNDLWKAIEAFSRDKAVDVIAAFASSPPSDRWIRIRRHVLMWNGVSNESERFAPDRWELGFYDVV